MPISVFTVEGKATTIYGFEDAAAAPTGSAPPSSETVTTSQSGTVSPTAAPEDRKHVPAGAIAGAILGVLVLLSLCLAALIIRRRRAQRSHQGEIRSLGSHVESDIIMSEEDTRSALPTPLILHDKEKALFVGPAAGDSVSASSSNLVLPPAAEVALANMAEEVQNLRTQMQRLEREQQLFGTGVDDLPPRYAPVAG